MTEEKLREVYDKYYRLVMKAAYDVLKISMIRRMSVRKCSIS